MVQILPPRGSTLQQLLLGAATGLPDALKGLLEQKESTQEDTALKKLGYDVEGVKDPKLRQMLVQSKIKGQSSPFPEGIDIVSAYKNLNPTQKAAFDKQYPSESASIRRSIKESEPKGGITAQPVPQEYSSAIENILTKNPDATASELSVQFDKAGIPRGFSNSYIETRRREQEQKEKKSTAIETEIRKEVLPIKKDIAEKAMQAREAILNKENLLNLIDQGNLDDPTFSTVAYAVPYNLAKRFLSNDTVEYKAALLDEFGDLRKMFQGQTRVKELEIFEDKLADLYLTDEQKKAVLKSRIRSLEGDIIRAEAAEQVEKEQPNLGILQFEKAVAEKMKPKMEALANKIISEHEAILKEAERKKQFSLDPNEPEDKKILLQILQEAGGDKEKARKIATEKGYKF